MIEIHVPITFEILCFKNYQFNYITDCGMLLSNNCQQDVFNNVISNLLPVSLAHDSEG